MRKERKGNLFKEVPIRRPRRSNFDLSHEVKMSGKFGYLYPVLLLDTLPGDVITDEMSAMVRFAPMAAPVMHRCDVTTHFFFVPIRIICDFWENFITGGQDGTLAPVLPYVTPAGLYAALGGSEVMRQGSLWDYLGLPVAPAVAPTNWSTEQISALPFYAIAKVWNDYYRDPNLPMGVVAGELPIPSSVEGNVSANSDLQNILFALTKESDYSYLRRAFEKDYFTSALPWAQRGAQVLMPLSGVAEAGDITYKAATEVFSASVAAGDKPVYARVDANGDGTLIRDPAPGYSMEVRNIDEITFDNAATTINDLRRALAIQRWLEANARGGGRYTEQIMSHFATMVPDYRLQRAEYLGGGKQPVQISEVLAHASTDEGATGTAQVGDLYGHGLSVGRTNRFRYRCQEHGFVIGFTSVTLRTAYSQGIPRMFSRADKFDFAFPELAHLGEQEILSKEVFFSFDSDDDEANGGVFGYIPRYAEYKFHNDRIAGDFRGSLSFWHLGRRFTQRPSLDFAFTTLFENGDGPDDIDVASSYEESFRRIFNVNDGTDYLWMQLYHRLWASRPLPYFGVPQI